MSLQHLNSTDELTYVTTGDFAAIAATSGYRLAWANWTFGFIKYYARTAQLLVQGQSPTCAVWMDPLFINNTGLVTIITLTPPFYWLFGEWNKATGTQVIYGRTSLDPGYFSTLDYVTLQVLPADPYPEIDWTGSANLAVGDVGYWGWTPQNGMMVFETIGKGYAFAQNHRAPTGTITNVLVEIELSTGFATVIQECHLYYTANPLNIYQGRAPYGESSTFSLKQMEFIQDVDSTPAAPKGIIHFFAHSPVFPVASIARFYMKAVEFNPTGVSGGTPSRVHWRELLLTRADTLWDVAAASDGIGGRDPIPGTGPAPTGGYWWIDRNSGNPKGFFGWNASGTTTNDEQVLAEYINTPALSVLTAPSALSEIEIDGVREFAVRAYGDVGEAISGQVIDWTLKRRSTVGESLNTVGLPATSTISNTPVDDETETVYYLGTPLTGGGTDYTLVPATGVVTWAGAHPLAASGYTVDYEHKTLAVAPGHGTLLVAQSSTNSDGMAVTRVKYDNDSSIVSHFDELTASGD